MTSEDVQKVAASYFRAENRVVVTVLPRGQRMQGSR
jgi:predicted Zn-dependent peptidase